jgi:hypothetical protein
VDQRSTGSFNDEDQSQSVPGFFAVRTILLLSMAAALGALALNAFDLSLPGRPLLAVVSLFSVPGIPLAFALPISNFHVQLVIGLALSLAAVLIVTTIQVESGAWSPLLTQLSLAVIGSLATVFVLRGRAVR